jgi:hypothetical protein
VIALAVELTETGTKDSRKTPPSCYLNIGTNGTHRWGDGISLVKACLFGVTLHNYINSWNNSQPCSQNVAAQPISNSWCIITCPVIVFGSCV